MTQVYPWVLRALPIPVPVVLTCCHCCRCCRHHHCCHCHHRCCCCRHHCQGHVNTRGRVLHEARETGHETEHEKWGTQAQEMGLMSTKSANRIQEGSHNCSVHPLQNQGARGDNDPKDGGTSTSAECGMRNGQCSCCEAGYEV